MSVRRFQRLVWAGSFIYLGFLIAILFFEIPRIRWELSPGFSVKNSRQGLFVQRADPSTGLHPGDRILSINGNKRFGTVPLVWTGPGVRMQVEVQGQEGTRSTVLTVSKRPAHLTPQLTGLQLLTSLAFFILTVFVAWKKPESHSTRVMCMASGLCALAYLDLALDAAYVERWLLPDALWLPAFVMPFHYVGAYWFASVFPSQRSSSRLWRMVTAGVVALGVWNWLTALPGKITLFGIWGPILDLQRLPLWPAISWRIYDAGLLLTGLATSAVLVRNYRWSGAQDRRRIVWVMASIGIAVLGTALVGLGNSLGLVPSPVLFLADATALFVPATLGYAITKHQVMGIQVALRRSLQYILARRVLQCAIVLPTLALIILALLRPEMRVRELVRPEYAGLVIFAGLALLERREILNAVDRRFFRSAWDEEQILSSLLTTIRGQVDFAETEAVVSHRLEKALHPETMLIVYRQERGGPLAWLDTVFAEHSPFFEELSRNASLVVSASVRNVASPAEKLWLDETRADLIVPIPGVVRLRGLMVLGPKKSGEPYVASERKLLESVAAQMSVAHETHWLANERVAAVLAERNRMARELHDSLAQGFAGISLHLQSAARTIQQAPDTAVKHVEQARQLARSSLAEARRSVHDLRRAASQSPDLAAMLQELAAQLSSESVVVEVYAHNLPGLPPDVAGNLFRIAQESVTNALKHAGASRIVVEVSAVGKDLVLKVTDNGCGFDTREPRPGGYGIIGMRERATQVNGHVEVKSRMGEGTEIIALARYL